MRVDSHQHFWRLSRGDYGWLRGDDAGLAPLCRDFAPAELQPLLRAHGVAQTVLVQAAPTSAETEYLLELAGRHDFIAGVVGWVDLADAASVATLERWAAQRKLKGIRPMLQDLPLVDWIEHAPRPEVVQALVRHGLRFDALVRPPQLKPLLSFVRRHPALPVVVDHAAKPPLRMGEDRWGMDDWRQRIGELAAQPQVCCKFSGLLTEAPRSAVSSVASALDAVRPVWDELLRCFGPARLLWGSDWPVLTLAADYAGWIAVAEALIGELSEAEQAQVWSGSAQRFYGLEPGGVSRWT